jgi:hypothetical protein
MGRNGLIRGLFVIEEHIHIIQEALQKAKDVSAAKKRFQDMRSFVLSFQERAVQGVVQKIGNNEKERLLKILIARSPNHCAEPISGSLLIENHYHRRHTCEMYEGFISRLILFIFNRANV